MSLLYGNLDAAIGQAEGYNTPGSISNLANNPGDIIAGPYATAHGATGVITAAGGTQIATFPDPATGIAATDALVASKVNGGVTDLTSLAQSWLGSNASPTDVSNYANNLASALGGNPSGLPGSTASSTTSNVASTVAQAVTNSIFGGISWTRVAAGILGFVFIIGAIFMLAIGGVLGGAESLLEGHKRVTRVAGAVAALP